MYPGGPLSLGVVGSPRSERRGAGPQGQASSDLHLPLTQGVLRYMGDGFITSYRAVPLDLFQPSSHLRLPADMGQLRQLALLHLQVKLLCHM